MKHKNVWLFLIVCFLSGVCTLVGSVLGTRLVAGGLLWGAFAGGIVGVMAATWVATRLALIERANYNAGSIGGVAGFILASIVAITNLHTSIIPLASITLVGLGTVLGNRYLTKGNVRKSDTALALIGFVLSAPALFFVSASLLKYGLGVGQLFDLLGGILSNPERLRTFNLVSPFVFLGGLLAALVLNLYPQVGLQVRREGKRFVLTITAEAKPINLAIIGLCSLLLVTLVGYVALENLSRL